MIVSAAEIASLWMPPWEGVGDQIERVMAQWLPATANAFIDSTDPRQIPLGIAEKSDGSEAPIGMSYDRFRYICHITAPMGRGKSEWLRNLIAGLLNAGSGFMALDCKAKDLVNTTLPIIPMHREKDVTLLDLEGSQETGEDLRVMMNLLTPSLARSLKMDPSMMASVILSIFGTLDKRFNDAPAIQNFATMAILALLGGEAAPTMMHLIRFLGDDDYRAEVCGRLSPAFMKTRDFWERRFPLMPDGEKMPLRGFERRLDSLLVFPELQAMLVAPGCSVDLRRMMDNNGIFLMGISASQGKIATVAISLLLTQLRLAALSRSNVPEAQRPDWPMIVDEVQVIANANAELFQIMLSQFRSMRVGQAYVHQGLSQLGPDVMGPLSDNAASRVILGCEANDAGTYAGLYGGLGLTREDFTRMEVHTRHGFALHQYMKLQGAGDLFSSRPLPMAQPLNEGFPPPVYVNWRTVRAEAKTTDDRDMDAAMAGFQELARHNYDEAVARLGVLAMRDPRAFDTYCARTRAHRAAQRQFIIDHPGCITVDRTLDPPAAWLKQKTTRIRILSALGGSVPKLETESLAWGLTRATIEADEARQRREADAAPPKKGAKKKSGVASPAAAPTRATVTGIAEVGGTAGGASNDTAGVATTRLPTLAELSAERRARGRRDGDDFSDGLDDLQGDT